MILTPHLEITPWAEADASDFFELTQDAGFNLHPITQYQQPDLESARQWIRTAHALFQKTGLGKFAVREKQSHTLIGMGGLTPWTCDEEPLVDITYRLRESAWGKGYGLELPRALTRYAFETAGLTQITATITPDNITSQKIAAKLGMRFDKRILLLGVETDLFRLQKKDFLLILNPHDPKQK